MFIRQEHDPVGIHSFYADVGDSGGVIPEIAMDVAFG
tara:strand:- start:1269 stop:1379 length:111 start_codon:yes stop_codon:yes gene_type:complete